MITWSGDFIGQLEKELGVKYGKLTGYRLHRL